MGYGRIVRLYLCDDNASHRALYRHALRAAPDLELVGATADPRRARHELRQLRPDAVLLDVSMPGFDGFAALPLIRETVPAAAVIMFSTAWSSENERRALSAGASAYVQKPLNILDLPALIRGAVGDASALVQHLVERWLAGEIDRAVAALDHEVEVFSLSHGIVRGIEELRRLAGHLPAGIKAASLRPVELLERRDRVVLLANAELTRSGPTGDYRESMRPAWVMTARHGKLARIQSYASWDDARTAADIGAENAETKRRRLSAAGRWVMAAALRRPRPAIG
jgi:DNA-binding NarL/FixJ family response regulator